MKKILAWLANGMIVAWCTLMTVPAGAALPVAIEGQTLPTLAPMLDQATPAVVNIATRGHVAVQQNPLLSDPFFRRFFNVPEQPRERQTQSLGSGVIVDAQRGYVLTNNHVIDKADEITVTLRDGRHLNAKLIGTDPESDVAVLQIPTENLTALPLADSSQLRVGDFVVAIGNPFGLGQTVTSGIVSALGRSGLGIEGYEDFIQTDASINPGNSGGPLVDRNGRVIGINDQIFTSSGGNEGIGFAISIDLAVIVANQIVAGQDVRTSLLGISTVPNSEARNPGVLVDEVSPGSAADTGGIQVGDVIVSFDGDLVTDIQQLQVKVQNTPPGTKVDIELIRNGEQVTIEATLGRGQ